MQIVKSLQIPLNLSPNTHMESHQINFSIRQGNNRSHWCVYLLEDNIVLSLYTEVSRALITLLVYGSVCVLWLTDIFMQGSNMNL